MSLFVIGASILDSLVRNAVASIAVYEYHVAGPASFCQRRKRLHENRVTSLPVA